ncbi:MAG: hypothetical protein EA344_04075 [Alkalicoccus sp.]|nr:MAG: hypothetical protein EA344_04075 [Alkalicoccus sp.]
MFLLHAFRADRVQLISSAQMDLLSSIKRGFSLRNSGEIGGISVVGRSFFMAQANQLKTSPKAGFRKEMKFI